MYRLYEGRGMVREQSVTVQVPTLSGFKVVESSEVTEFSPSLHKNPQKKT